jgi:ribose transport system substrate-binding protein
MSVINPRPLPSDLEPSTATPAITQMYANDGSNTLGTEDNLNPVWYTSIKPTTAEIQAICSKHLTGVYLDWSGVPFNKAIESGITQMFQALHIKLLRITDYSFNPNGLAGELSALLPLKPNIVMTGGAISPQQFGAIMQPAVAQGAAVTTWGLGSTTWNTGQSSQLKAVVAYDFYYLGEQLAAAVHAAYPNGANLGYIHWINDSLNIHEREQGFLDALKAYPNIHIITPSGAPASPESTDGFSDDNGAEAYTIAFLRAHPSVNVLFAPWEDPPALGEAAAIQSLGLTGKVHVVTMDLSNDGAQQLVHNGTISVDMAEDMYDAGRTMALTAALSEIGKDNHPYVLIPTFAANKNNVVNAWNFMHGPQIPCPAADCG